MIIFQASDASNTYCRTKLGTVNLVWCKAWAPVVFKKKYMEKKVLTLSFCEVVLFAMESAVI